MDNQNLFNGDNGDIPANEPPKTYLKSIKTKTKNKMNLKNLKLGKAEVGALVILMIVAMVMIGRMSVPDGANDPLGLTKNYGLSQEDKDKMQELEDKKGPIKTSKRNALIEIAQYDADLAKIDQSIVDIFAKYSGPVAFR